MILCYVLFLPHWGANLYIDEILLEIVEKYSSIAVDVALFCFMVKIFIQVLWDKVFIVNLV